MSVHRLLKCDAEGCRATFRGTRAEASKAGWSRAGHNISIDRCPACRLRIGKRQRGEDNPYARLKEADVLEIRRAVKDGESIMSQARRFNVNHETIRKIALGKTWRHVSEKTVLSRKAAAHMSPERAAEAMRFVVQASLE